MTSAWPELEQLIHELGDVCALPNSEGEPSLSQATMAVTKAATALARAAQVRGRGSSAALAQAEGAVREAREALHAARMAIAAAARKRGSRRPATSAGAPDAPIDGQAEASCPACGRGFVVRYRVTSPAPVVAFPVACPASRCDGVREVEYPATAVDVSVEAAPG